MKPNSVDLESFCICLTNLVSSHYKENLLYEAWFTRVSFEGQFSDGKTMCAAFLQAQLSRDFSFCFLQFNPLFFLEERLCCTMARPGEMVGFLSVFVPFHFTPSLAIKMFCEGFSFCLIKEVAKSEYCF